uniref:Uncharacterized protein n=1 Tax=Oryza rufipogon TaxID=4529 RepID=A0A0E0NY37_ORYRU
MAEDPDSDGAPDDLLDVGADHGDLGHEPERAVRPVRVPAAAELGEVPPRGHPEARGEQLHEQAHGRGLEEQPEQRVAGGRAGLEVVLEVARVQERDAHQEPRPREQPQPAPREGRHGHAAAAGEGAVVVGVGVTGGRDD